MCCSGDLPSPWKSKGFNRTFHVYDPHHGTSSPPPLLFPQARQGKDDTLALNLTGTGCVPGLLSGPDSKVSLFLVEKKSISTST